MNSLQWQQNKQLSVNCVITLNETDIDTIFAVANKCGRAVATTILRWRFPDMPLRQAFDTVTAIVGDESDVT